MFMLLSHKKMGVGRGHNTPFWAAKVQIIPEHS